MKDRDQIKRRKGHDRIERRKDSNKIDFEHRKSNIATRLIKIFSQ